MYLNTSCHRSVLSEVSTFQTHVPRIPLDVGDVSRIRAASNRSRIFEARARILTVIAVMMTIQVRAFKKSLYYNICFRSSSRRLVAFYDP